MSNYFDHGIAVTMITNMTGLFEDEVFRILMEDG